MSAQIHKHLLGDTVILGMVAG